MWNDVEVGAIVFFPKFIYAFRPAVPGRFLTGFGMGIKG